MIKIIEIGRFSLTSYKSFDQVVAALTASVQRSTSGIVPDSGIP